MLGLQDAGTLLPRELSSYPVLPGHSLFDILLGRVQLEPFNAVATAIFLLAVAHTFVAARFTKRAHRLQREHDEQAKTLGRLPRPSVAAEILHLYFDRVSQIHLAHWSAGRVGVIGDAAACVSLLAGEGTGLAMIEAYVLAGELHRSGGHVGAGLAAFERRLRSFVNAKQKTALRFRGFFTPRSALGLTVRNLAVRAVSIPFVANRLIDGSLRDDLVLPHYAAT